MKPPERGKGQDLLARTTAFFLAVAMTACHSGEKHAATDRMRRIMEGLSGRGNRDHAVCLWGHGSPFCPGGATDYSMTETVLRESLLSKGIDTVKSFEIGKATYVRGDGGMFKISPVVNVKLTINGAKFEVECIDAEVVKWVNCSDCAVSVSGGVSTTATASIPLPVQPAKATPTPTPRPALDGPRLFALVSPSVLVVETFDKRGRKLKQGSAVSLDANTAITNWHVISKAATIKILKGKDKFDATLDAVLENRDLARIRTLTELVPVPVAEAPPNVGEVTFALGAPYGFDLTISEGILSGKREDEGDKTSYLQTTAPISSGSSGGGLFNARGELIGITTMQVRAAQNLNFALPATYVSELMSLPPGTLPTPPLSMLTKLSAVDRQWIQAFSRRLANLDKEFIHAAKDGDRARALIASLGPLEGFQMEALRFELGGGMMMLARAFWEDAIDARTKKKFVKSSKRLKVEQELIKRGLVNEAEVVASDQMMENIAAGRDLVLEGITLVAEERVLASVMQLVARREALIEGVLWRP